MISWKGSSFLRRYGRTSNSTVLAPIDIISLPGGIRNDRRERRFRFSVQCRHSFVQGIKETIGCVEGEGEIPFRVDAQHMLKQSGPVVGVKTEMKRLELRPLHING